MGGRQYRNQNVFDVQNLLYALPSLNKLCLQEKVLVLVRKYGWKAYKGETV